MTQANQNQNLLDHSQGNTHNDCQTHTRKRGNPQSTSTNDNKTGTNKSILLSLLFSQSLHLNLGTHNKLLHPLHLHQLPVNMIRKTIG